MYSGRHYDVEKAFLQFEEETGTKVEFLTGNDAELRERIQAEGKDTEADVYITVDAGNLASAAEDGLFQPMHSEALRKVIPAQYRDPDDLWFALALRARTIIYNTDDLDEDEVPKDYEDLADPEWKGKVCMRNSTNGYQQSLVASMIAQKGEAETLEILEGWTRNAEIYANDTEMIEAMAAGACEVGIANHYYLARAIEEDPDIPVDLIWATRTRAAPTSTSPAAASPSTPRTRSWLRSSSSGWAPRARACSSTATTSSRPTPRWSRSRSSPRSSALDFMRQPLDAKQIGELNPEAVKLMDQAGFG